MFQVKIVKWVTNLVKAVLKCYIYRKTSRLAKKVKEIDEIQGEAQVGEKSLEN